MKNTILIIIFSVNLQLAGFDCFSTDPKLSDSAFWASKAIDLFAKKQYEESIITVDACFDIYTPEAVIMQNRFNSENKRLPPSGRVSRNEKEKIHSNWAVNDVSIAIWAKARSLDVLGRKELAMKAYSQCIFLTHGRAWDPNGWFWSPSADCAKKAKKYLNK